MQRTFDLALAWPRFFALALGIAAGLGFEPIGLWPLTLIALCGLMLLIQHAASRGRAFELGWAFALGLFGLSLNWLPTAFTYQAAMPAWLGWLAELVLSAILAVFPALASLAAWQTRRRPAALVLALAGSWILTEWREALTKGAFVRASSAEWRAPAVDLIETMRFEPATGIAELEAHIQRMRDSAVVLGI